MNQPTLYLLRGLPGAGKSSLAKTLSDCGVVSEYFEADSFFVDANGNYNFDPSKLSQAHKECQDKTRWCLSKGYSVAVANTLTTDKEIDQYMKIAEDVGAKVVSLIVENRHGNQNIHNVPEEAIEKMNRRFVVSL